MPAATRPLSPFDLFSIVWKHRGKVLLWSVLCVVLAVLAVRFLPRTYESTAKLFVRLGRETVTVDPTATTGNALHHVQDSRENQINSTRDMLESRALLEQVVERLGAETVLKGASRGTGTHDPGWMEWASDRLSQVKSVVQPNVISNEEQAVTQLSKSIGTHVARNSSVVEVSCKAKDPYLARKILETFVEEYQQQHLKANRTAGSLEFFTDQSANYKTQLDEATERLRQAKNESALISIEAEQESLQKQLVEMEAAALAAEAELTSSQASIESLRKSLAAIPEHYDVQKTSGHPNVAADYMRQEFFKVQMNLRDLEAKLGPEHPLVLTAREQVKQSEKILDAQPQERVQVTTGINPAYQAIDLDLRREEIHMAAVSAKNQKLKEQYLALQERTRALNEYEVRIAELERQVEIAANTYRSYVDHREQARIGEALAASQISNVNVVQPPSLVEMPKSPKPALVLGFGIFAAVCGSVGLAYCCEYLATARATVAETARPSFKPTISSPLPQRHEAELAERQNLVGTT